MASCSQVNSFFQAHVDGELDPSEDRILASHLEECTCCRAEIAAMAAFHRELVSSCAMHRQQRSLREAVLAHLPEMDPALHHGSHPTDPGNSPISYRFRLPLWLAACAALVVVVGILAMAVVYPARGPAASGDAIGMVVFTDGAGVLRKTPGAPDYVAAPLKTWVASGDEVETLDSGRVAVAIAQGSSLKMNVQTHVTVVDSRHVYVFDGQAYFDVGRDRRHFFVNTPTGEILVYGTSFLVDVAGDVTTVSVVEGDVLVSTPEGRSAVSHGKRSALRRGHAPTPPEDTPGDFRLDWVASMKPDADAISLFEQTIASRGVKGIAVPAEAVYAVRHLGQREVEGVMLSWAHDGVLSGHCGYFLHVSDSNDNLLFLDTVNGNVFDDPLQDSVTLLPMDGPISGVDVIHVRLIPDFTSGSVESTIRVNAVVH